MRRVTVTQLRADKPGQSDHSFSAEVHRARRTAGAVQIVRSKGLPEERNPARLVSYDKTWVKLAERHRPKKVQMFGMRQARDQLRSVLDAAIDGVHTVVTVDGVPYAVIVPTRWHERATEGEDADSADESRVRHAETPPAITHSLVGSSLLCPSSSSGQHRQDHPGGAGQPSGGERQLGT